MQVFSDLFAQLVIILVLVIANGVFSMAELSIVSARKVRLQQRADDGDKKARTALDLAESPNRFLSTVQIGITLIGTLAGALGGAGVADDVKYLLMQIPLLRPYAAGLALALVVLVVTYLSLVLGELVPKRLALANPEDIAGNIAGPMKWLSVLGRPVVWLLSVSTEAVLRLMRVRNTGSAPVTPEEITGLMEQGEVTGVFEEAETDIVESVFRLGDLRAGALMTPRTDIDWLDLDEPLNENLRRIMDSPHTHFPVAQGSLDNVQGILRGKDILARITDGKQVEIREMIQPALFIPESMPAFEVVELLKGASGNLALVIDEYGGLLGIVTLFDVMEALVGGISERGEPVVPEAIQREDGSWLVEGMMRIDEFKKLFDIDELPEENRAGYLTVGGFVMAMAGAIPHIGQHFDCCGWRFEVMDMDGMRVDMVLVGRE